MILKLSWKWIETKTHTYRIKVDGQKGRNASNDDRKYLGCVSLKHSRILTYVLTYVTKCNSIVFERFSVDSRKRIKTVVWTRIDRCVFDDNENAYF